MRKLLKNYGKVFSVLAVVMLVCSTAFAQSLTVPSATTGIALEGESQFMMVIAFMARWMRYIGLIVAFFGAIQIGFAFHSDDAEGKNKGMRAMASGFIVYAISAAIGFFFSI